MMARIKLALTLAVRGPFLFPGIATGAPGVDAVQSRDESGRPILPASQIQGLLRESLIDLSALAPGVIQPGQVETLFGGASPEAGAFGEQDLPMRGRLLMGNLVAAENLPRLGETTRVEIDDITGAARPGHLQITELVAKFGQVVPFNGEAILLWDANEAGGIVHAIDCALKLLTSVGAFKTAGFGALVAENCGAKQIISAPIIVPEPTSVSERIGLAASFDRPILVDAAREADNAFVGAIIVPGAVFKGALARKLGFAQGRTPPDDTADDSYARALSALVISHAFPEAEQDIPGGDALPLSLVAGADSSGVVQFGDDLRLPDSDRAGGPMIGDRAALFTSDWKPDWFAGEAEARRPGHAPFDEPKRLPRTHTRIKDGLAADGQLFTTIARSVLRADGGARRWLMTVDLVDVPDNLKTEAYVLIKMLRDGLDGLGRTGASVTFKDWPPGNRCPDINHVLGHPALFAVVLRTAAVLTDPRAGGTARAAYEEYWRTVLPAAELIDFCAAQRLAGGYQATRFRPWNSTYHPFVMTQPGSVFLLRGPIEGELKRLARRGLSLPGFAGAAPLDWRNCPFVPQNGFGAIRVDHLSDVASFRRLEQVRHV